MSKVATVKEVEQAVTLLRKQGDRPLYVKDGAGVSVVLVAWEPQYVSTPSVYWTPSAGRLLTAYANGNFGNGPIESFEFIESSGDLDAQFAIIVNSDTTRNYLAYNAPAKKQTTEVYYIAKGVVI